MVFKSDEGPGLRNAELDNVDLQCFQHNCDRGDEGMLRKDQYVIHNNSISFML